MFIFRSRFTLALLWSAALVLPAGIAQAQPAPASVHPCTEITDNTARLACFDQAFPPSPAASAAREQAAREQFGLSEEDLRRRDPERPRGDSTPAHIQATITVLSYRRSGERLITLDNGQTWLETTASRHGVIKEGDSVEIRRAVGGSYRLMTPARVGLRVRRVQ